ncbi:ParB/RepB/Spo0J family partition protein [Endothiovibrio diazotrophicus]
MAVKKRGLGRGLDALLGAKGAAARGAADGSAVGETGGVQAEGDTLRQLSVELIQRGKYQPRMVMDPDSLEELAASIRAQGVVQPIVVRPITAGRYEIIAGERRWRASQLAGLTEIPAVVREVPDEAAVAMALIENIQRENLNPLEEAYALQRLIDEFDMTHQLAADAVGRSRAAVSNLLRLIDLTDEVKRLLETRRLEMGHARALLALEPELQAATARKVADRGLTVRETEQLVKRLQNPPEPKAPRPVADEVRRIQEELGSRLGAKVAIQSGNKGKGKLVISYDSSDELNGILARIK